MPPLSPILCNPLVVASCHLTGNSKHIRSLVKTLKFWPSVNKYDSFPGAIVLKSVSEKGGDGNSGIRQMWSDREYPFLRFTDGPKQLELLTPETAVSLYNTARIEFPKKTKIGASILMGEKSTINNAIHLQDAGVDFIELNTKYLSRKYQDHNYLASDKSKESFYDFQKEVNEIIQKCNIPIWIKFARDILWLKTLEIIEFSKTIEKPNVSFVIANTQQVYVQEKGKTPDGKAVLWGKCLYANTYDLLVHLRNHINPNIPLIANGGVTTYKQTLALLQAGANAVEFCVFFHDGNRDFASWKADMGKTSSIK
jgi:dihydroorotate dehydrogenase